MTQQQDNNAPRQAVINKVFGSVFGNVEQHIAAPAEPAPVEPSTPETATAEYVSPVHLVKKKGNKIDLIRIANAIYELGMVDDGSGARLTKKDYMTAFGRAFNIDLSDYDKDLSNSMASSVAYDKQTRIFDEMKEKHQEIYNSK